LAGTERAERWLGLVRSLIVYRRPGRVRGLCRLYAPFVGPGDLVFDVGAHLGDRTAAFARLGARVVALEPQPHVRRWLERLTARGARVTVRPEAVGRAEGTAVMAVSRLTPTLSSLSTGWRASLPGANPTFRGVRWEESIEVPVTTLDILIETHGQPCFCKIDVEGYEADVLAGLTHRVPALSFEFVTGRLDVAVECVRRMEELGGYELNVISGEEREFVFSGWIDARRMIEWLGAGAGGASSGDVYARSVR
jgi:FkbM family methyltransferase